MIKRLLGYFLKGLALIAPIFLTLWILFSICNWLNEFCNFEFMILGIIIFLATVTFIGYLAPYVLSNIIWKNFEGLLYKIPLFGPIYRATKDLTSAIVGSENKFSEPVMVEFNGNEIMKLGFVTRKDVSILSDDANLKNLVMVYFPISFSLSGDMYLVPIDKISPIDRNAKDIMQVIISGGLIKAD